jgi:hypothetical protein
MLTKPSPYALQDFARAAGRDFAVTCGADNFGGGDFGGVDLAWVLGAIDVSAATPEEATTAGTSVAAKIATPAPVNADLNVAPAMWTLLGCITASAGRS